MAMDSYANINAEVESWLNREGFTALEAKTKDFMDMGQRRIFRECNFHAFEDSATNTTGTSLALPSDFLRAKSFYIIYGSNAKEVQGSSFVNVLRSRTNGTDVPELWARVGNTIELGPEPDSDYTWHLVYYKSLPLLSDANTTNYFTDNNPEILLYASLLEACLWLKDDVRANVWKQKYEEVKAATELSEAASGKESGTLQVRADSAIY